MLGNPVDGYEQNAGYLEGEVNLPPDYTKEQVVHALIDAGHLGQNAVQMFQAGELAVQDDYDSIEVTEQEIAWAAVQQDDVDAPPQEDRFIDMLSGRGDQGRRAAEEQIDPETERVERVEGFRPVLQLLVLEGRSATVPFLRQKMKDGSVLELRVDPEKPVEEKRSGKADFSIDSYVDGDFFGAFGMDDLDGAELGIGKNGKKLEGDEELESTARVAMDAFWEQGGIGPEAFVTPKESLLPAEAKRLLDALRENSEAYHHKEITYEVFGERNRKLWDRAREQGVSSEIAPLIAPPSPGISGARELRVGDHVRFVPGATHPISNFELDIGGETGTVKRLDEHEAWIELDALHPELNEWDNTLHFDLDALHFPQIEPLVEQALEQRRLPYKPSGLNADWSVQAWMLSDGAPNRVNGAYYLLDSEDDRGNYLIVRRFYEGEPGYEEANDGVEEVISDGPLSQVLDEYMGIADRD
jgi:hypothetical protein